MSLPKCSYRESIFNRVKVQRVPGLGTGQPPAQSRKLSASDILKGLRNENLLWEPTGVTHDHSLCTEQISAGIPGGFLNRFSL